MREFGEDVHRRMGTVGRWEVGEAVVELRVRASLSARMSHVFLLVFDSPCCRGYQSITTLSTSHHLLLDLTCCRHPSTRIPRQRQAVSQYRLLGNITSTVSNPPSVHSSTWWPYKGDIRTTTPTQSHHRQLLKVQIRLLWTGSTFLLPVIRVARK